MKELIKFELFYKLLMYVVALPVLSALAGLFIKYVISDSVIYNFDMVLRLLNIPGIVFIILYCIVILLLIYFEYVVVYKLIYLSTHHKSVHWTNLCLASLKDLKAFKLPSSIAAFLYFVLLNPLWHLGFVSSFLPSVSIPAFITNEVLKMEFGSVLCIALYLILFVLYGSFIFTPFYMIYKQESFPEACKSSMKKMIHSRRIWLFLIAIFLVYYYFRTYLFRNFLLSPSDFNFYFIRYFVYYGSFRIRTLVFAGFSIVWTIVETLFIREQIKSEKDLEPVCSFEAEPFWHKINLKEVLRRHKIAYAIVFFVSGALFIIFYFRYTPLLHLPYSIGHRGDISQPENSLEGILAADSNHADFAEIDLQLTKDNVLVVCHDTNLKRLTGNDVNIKDLTLAEIEKLETHNKAGNTAHIPTLEEAIRTAKNAPNEIGLLIEFKPLEGDEEETVNQTIELVEKYDFTDRAMFMSMDQYSMEMLAKKRPDWWIGYCAFGNLGRINIRLNDPFIPDFIAIEESSINTQLLEDARNYLLPVYVWTVDDTEKVIEYLKMGVSGIIGDATDQVVYGVEQFESTAPKDAFHYITTCPGFPQLTEDEYGYIQCERPE